MNKNLRITMLCLPLVSGAYSQELFRDSVPPTVTNVTRLTLGAGFSVERKIAQTQTLYAQVFPSINLSLYFSDGLGGDAELWVAPGLNVQYRYYYNGKRRQRKFKRTARNTMNYFALADQMIWTRRRVNDDYADESRARLINTIGILWGLQRNWERSRLSVDFSVGPAYRRAKSSSYYFNGVSYSDTYSAVTLLTQFNIGFWLNKRS